MIPTKNLDNTKTNLKNVDSKKPNAITVCDSIDKKVGSMQKQSMGFRNQIVIASGQWN